MLSDKQKLKEAEAIIKQLLRTMPEGRCEYFGHSKKELHEWNEPCPCQERYEAAVVSARAFLKKGKH